jgi:hypothetical protein
MLHKNPFFAEIQLDSTLICQVGKFSPFLPQTPENWPRTAKLYPKITPRSGTDECCRGDILADNPVSVERYVGTWKWE